MGGGGGDGGAGERRAEEAQKQALRNEINTLFDAPEAKQRFADEESQLSNTLRQYYSDELKRGYGESERQVRFGAANTGNVGGSAYADQVAKLNEQNALGGTRIEEAVRRAINNLRGGREDTRMRSINLVNSGSGSDAAASAAAGLRQSLDSANSANRENIFSDLFGNLAFARVLSDNAAKQSAANQLYGNRLGAFFAPQPNSGGTIVRTEF